MKSVKEDKMSALVCRHYIRASVRAVIPNVSGVDSKLG